MAIQVAHTQTHILASAPHRRPLRNAHTRARESHVKSLRAPPRLLFKVGASSSCASASAPATAAAAAAATTSTRAQLPRKLRRPALIEFDAYQSEHRRREAMARLYPDLVDLPTEFVRVAYVQKHSTQLIQACARAEPIVEHRRTGLGVPKRIPIYTDTDPLFASCEADRGLAPTHFLAVTSSSAGNPKQPATKDRTVTLFPVHALAFLASCNSVYIPTFPSPPSSSTNTGTRSLPVVPLALPHPRSFPLLLSFLYTHSTHQLLPSLLPLSPAQLSNSSNLNSAAASLLSGVLARDPSACRTYTTLVADALDAGALLAHALSVYGVWENACFLGLDLDAAAGAEGQEMSFAAALELSWEVIVGAIALKNFNGARAARAASGSA